MLAASGSGRDGDGARQQSYPPFAPVLTARSGRHYGAATWARFAAAKQQFDPNGVLNPGAESS
jgi:FAD/FMN-containing dehydrogenase